MGKEIIKKERKEGNEGRGGWKEGKTNKPKNRSKA